MNKIDILLSLAQEYLDNSNCDMCDHALCCDTHRDTCKYKELSELIKNFYNEDK